VPRKMRLRAVTWNKKLGCNPAAVIEGHSMQQTKLSIKDMCCAEEVQSLEKAIGRLAGVSEVRPNLLNRAVLVIHDPGLTSSEDLIRAVNQAGMKARAGERDEGSSPSKNLHL